MDKMKDVSESVIREILEDAIWAPTHGLTQPWRFHVFAAAARERLADGLEALYDSITAPTERREDKRAKLRANVLTAPVTIAVAAKLEPNGKITEFDEIAATSCAIENILLSAHQRGLGSFWATPPVACSAEFAEWLGLGAFHRCMGLVYIGHAHDGITFSSSRLPLEQRAEFHYTR
jgi:nitroreductase